jgi:hypothetical protein
MQHFEMPLMPEGTENSNSHSKTTSDKTQPEGTQPLAVPDRIIIEDFVEDRKYHMLVMPNVLPEQVETILELGTEYLVPRLVKIMEDIWLTLLWATIDGACLEGGINAIAWRRLDRLSMQVAEDQPFLDRNNIEHVD